MGPLIQNNWKQFQETHKQIIFCGTSQHCNEESCDKHSVQETYCARKEATYCISCKQWLDCWQKCIVFVASSDLHSMTGANCICLMQYVHCICRQQRVVFVVSSEMHLLTGAGRGAGTGVERGDLNFLLKFWIKIKNIATGKTSPAITPFHLFDYFHFFGYLVS